MTDDERKVLAGRLREHADEWTCRGDQAYDDIRAAADLIDGVAPTHATDELTTEQRLDLVLPHVKVNDERIGHLQLRHDADFVKAMNLIDNLRDRVAKLERRFQSTNATLSAVMESVAKLEAKP